MRSGSHCPSEFLSIPAFRLGYVPEMNWQEGLLHRGLGKGLTTRRCGSVYLVVFVLRVGKVVLCVKGFVSRELELFFVKGWLRCMKRWSYTGRFYPRSWCEVTQDSFVGMKSELRFCSEVVVGQEPIKWSLHLPYKPLESTLSRVDL